MSRNQLVQKKKHLAKNVLHTTGSSSQEKWSPSDILTAIGLAIAFISLLFSLTTPELRQLLGFDRPPDPPPYPHLLLSYNGHQQDISDSKEMDIRLFITWQSPVESREGYFDGYIIFPLDGSQQCNITGSISPIDGSSFAQVNFTCVFRDYSEDRFQGEIYPDRHIAGTVASSVNPSFNANWHFFPPHDPDTMPAPQVDEHNPYSRLGQSCEKPLSDAQPLVFHTLFRYTHHIIVHIR